MRSLKELLELLLSEWEKLDVVDNICMTHFGLCNLLSKLEHIGRITEEESIKVEKFIYFRLPVNSAYLFPMRFHRERVEWLQERIKELS